MADLKLKPEVTPQIGRLLLKRRKELMKDLADLERDCFEPALPVPAHPATPQPFGTFVERSDGSTEFRRTGESHSPTALAYRAWTLYAHPDGVDSSTEAQPQPDVLKALTLGRAHAQWSADRAKDVIERRMCEHDMKRIDAAIAHVAGVPGRVEGKVE